jgi:CHAT domain-containing protein
MIHLACHNRFSETDGSTIVFDDGPWQPTDLTEAGVARTLAGAGPLVFLNACRSAGEVGWFSQMNGWAQAFVKAGAGAFVGSLWAVRSSSARAFAETFYRQFVDEAQPLGTASLEARKAIADDDGDPTWLAYTVYGNPAAKVATKERNPG